MINPYPGLEALKEQHKLTKIEGEKVFGSVTCSRCGGGGTVGVRYVWGGTCFKCGGAGVTGWVRIDAQGWAARERAREKNEERRVKASEARAEKAQEMYALNCEKLGGRDINALRADTLYIKTPLSDILSKAQLYPLTDKQIQAVENIIARAALIQEQREKEKAGAVLETEGRKEISGVIVTIKESEYRYTHNYSSYNLKMLVRRADGHKFWGSVPSNLQPKKGDTVTFTAMVKPKEAGFSFFSRPTKAAIVSMGPESQRIDDIMNRQTRLSNSPRPVQDTAAPEHHYDTLGRYNPPDYL